ncbi:ead/Ea22-like family protein [Salmonella enterica subsp. enterica serovar Minnesota]|nr:ead/Ea22-like family protein [Salmonella enterica subsp. enterica serovar Minnesota]
MTALNKQALRKLAKALSGKEWVAFVHKASGTYAIGSLGHERGEDIIKWPGFDGQDNAESKAKFIAAASPATVLALLDELEAAEKRIEEGICRANREHHRGFMMACNHLKEHANIHYADAAEMEIAALRQRIAELEARTVNLPAACADDEYFIDGVFQALRYERDVERAIRAAGIGVKGE